MRGHPPLQTVVVGRLALKPVLAHTLNNAPSEGKLQTIFPAQRNYSAVPSGTRMELAVDRLKPALIDVCINLGRRDVGMAQHFLHQPQIRPARQQMCGKAVP
jgi:hypothetical protein